MTHLKLIHTQLQFISLGGKVHARKLGLSPHDRAIDLSTITLCGRAIPDGTKAMESRAVDTSLICGKCYQSLRTYGSGQVRIERVEVEV